jgi:hypothetical protein
MEDKCNFIFYLLINKHMTHKQIAQADTQPDTADSERKKATYR